MAISTGRRYRPCARSRIRGTEVPRIEDLSLEFRSGSGTLPPELHQLRSAPPIQQISNCRNLTSLTIAAHERTPFTEEALINAEIDAVITQNPGHAVRSALRILRARRDNRKIVAPKEKSESKFHCKTIYSQLSLPLMLLVSGQHQTCLVVKR